MAATFVPSGVHSTRTTAGAPVAPVRRIWVISAPVTRSDTTTDPSLLPEATRPPSGLSATAYTSDGNRMIVGAESLSDDHTLTCSAEPATTAGPFAPAGPKPTEYKPRPASSVASSRPLRSHIRTVPSSLPVAMNRPSSPKSTARGYGPSASSGMSTPFVASKGWIRSTTICSSAPLSGESVAAWTARARPRSGLREATLAARRLRPMRSARFRCMSAS